MNTDIRVAVTCPDHPKIKKLMRRHGDIAFWNLIKFWSFVAVNKPQGDLSGYDSEDIEIGAGWNGEPGVFFQSLVDLRFINTIDGRPLVHDWESHNGWACHAEKRSEKARNAASARWEKRSGNAKPCLEQCNEHTPSNAPSPNPNPNPNPNPKDKRIAPAAFDPFSVRPDWFPVESFNDLIEHRKKKKATNTKRAIKALLNQIEKATSNGFSLESIVDEITNRNWTGFKAEWMKTEARSKSDDDATRSRWAKEILESEGCFGSDETVARQIQGPQTRPQ